MQAAVVIVGSDPVGSLLAGELRLGGLEVSLLDHRAEFERAEPARQARRALLARARRFGVDIRHGSQLVECTQDSTGVMLLLDGPAGQTPLRASYLIGCDGLRSTVRRLDGLGAEQAYRRGRILLAGDACHPSWPVDPRRLRLGLQDALNLAWKLAATMHGWAPAGLLDSYQAERQPVAARWLGHLQRDPAGQERLLRLLSEFAVRPDATRRLAGLITEPDVRYDLGAVGRHPLLGSPMPGWQLGFSDDSRVRATDLLRPGRGVLISTDRSRQVNRLAASWVDRIDIVTGRWLSRTRPATGSVLIRPDGYVAWVSPGGGELGGALRRWFGPPQPVPLARPARPLAANW